MAFQMNASGTFQEGHLYIYIFIHIYIITTFGFPIFQSLETKQKLLKSGKEPKFPQNLCPISLLSTTGKLLRKSFKN
jgi:hypothetical protein